MGIVSTSIFSVSELGRTHVAFLAEIEILDGVVMERRSYWDSGDRC